MHDQQSRVNAMISYFFLGWLMLANRMNPNFSDSFVQSHAKKASILHGIYLVVFLFYIYLIKPILIGSFTIFGYSISLNHIPVIGVTVHDVILWAIFGWLISQVLIGAYKSFQWEDVGELTWYGFSSIKEGIDSHPRAIQIPSITGSDIEWVNEQDKLIILTSYLPFIGIFAAQNYKHDFTRAGVRIGSTLMFAILLANTIFVTNSVIPSLLVFIYIIIIVFVGVFLFLQNKMIHLPFVENLPSIQDVGYHFRAILRYGKDFVSVIFWKSNTRLYREYFEEVKKRDIIALEDIRNQADDAALFTRDWILFVPFLNLIYIPSLLKKRYPSWATAIGQGLVITGWVIFFWMVFGFWNQYQTFLLFPIFLGIANIQANRFYKIPFVYDIVLLFHIVTFGIFTKENKIKNWTEKKREEKFSYEVNPNDTKKEE